MTISREILRQISVQPKVVSSVKELANKIISLTVAFAYFRKHNKEHNQEYNKDSYYTLGHCKDCNDIVLNILAPHKPNSRAYPKTIESLKEIIQNGNIRLWMTVIMFFGMNGCDIGWWLLFGYHMEDNYIMQIITDLDMSAKGIQNRINRMQKLTGYKLENIIETCGSDPLSNDTCVIYNKDEFLSVCHLFAYNMEGPVSVTRNPLFKPQLRDWVGGKYTFNPSELIPPPAGLELKTWQETDVINTLPGDEDSISSVSLGVGSSEWNLNNDNIYNKLAYSLNKDSIAGPSGNTDLQLQVSTLFTGYLPKEKCFIPFLLSIIVWMAGMKDHSTHEILLAAVPFGLNYDVRHNVDIFVEMLLDNVKHIQN